MVIEIFITCQIKDPDTDENEDIEFLQENSVLCSFSSSDQTDDPVTLCRTRRINVFVHSAQSCMKTDIYLLQYFCLYLLQQINGSC